MSSDFYYAPSKNGIQKTLSAQLLSTASTGDAISLSDVDGIQNKPGVLVINRVDSNGTATPAAREYISFTGTSGSTVLIETRNVDNSTSAKTHAVGSVVEFIPDVVWAQRIIDQQLVEHSVAGVHGSAAVTSIETAAVADESPILNSSMSRQAIINGNFDVWQRGTSLTIGAAGTEHLADRWKIQQAADGGTLPTIVHSRQLLTSGDIANSFFHYRIAPNGAGTSFGAASYGWIQQRVENATRNLCGNGKKVTLSFWARSTIANKKLGVFAQQSYGTGGSPTAIETINGINWTLTSTWTKYTHTFTTNTLASKTFGTAHDDYFSVSLAYQWNTTYDERVGASTSEDYVGSGNIDIAQVQLCAGDVALPFQPKSEIEEKLACQKYAFVPSNTASYSPVGQGAATSTTRADILVQLPVVMRGVPAITVTASEWALQDFAGNNTTITSMSVDGVSTSSMVTLTCNVASGLTQHRPYKLVSNNASGKILVLDKEL